MPAPVFPWRHWPTAPVPRPAVTEPTTKYDAVVRMLSLAEFAKSKRILLIQGRGSEFAVEEVHDVRIISVVGLFNKGKTFFLNKLFNVNLPCGKTNVTEGLSCLYIKERRMLIIDSPGVQSTVSFRSDSMDRVVDAQSTEAFLHELLSQISHHVLFVVNDFTSFEQRYMQLFQEKEQSCHRGVREIVVIHNLCDTADPKEAEDLFCRQISSRYDGIESHLSKLVYHSRRTQRVHPGAEEHDRETVVHHIAICKDGTPAGDQFNSSNLSLLLEHLEHTKKLPDQVVFTKLLGDAMEGLLPRFFFVEGSVDRILQYESDRNGEAESEQDDAMYPVGFFTTSCKKLEVKTEGVISDSGEVLSHDKSFNPEVLVYDQQVGQYLVRRLVVECPGIRHEHVKWETEGGVITLQIKKLPLVDEGSVRAVYGLRQQFGVFKKRIPLPDGPFELAEEECTLDRGVLTVTLKKCLLKRPIAESPAVPASTTSSLPSEAAGLQGAGAGSDAHPSAQEQETFTVISNGLEKIESPAPHCFTQTSAVLTHTGTQGVADIAGSGGAVKSVVLETEPCDGEPGSSQTPKNGLSPA